MLQKHDQSSQTSSIGQMTAKDRLIPNLALSCVHQIAEQQDCQGRYAVAGPITYGGSLVGGSYITAVSVQHERMLDGFYSLGSEVTSPKHN